MREIKFRAWNSNLNLMQYGDGNQGLFLQKALERKFEIMQYTGLKDKNGKEIYEGDIVEYSGWSKAGLETGAFSYKYQVTYDTEKFMFSVGSKMSLYNLSTLGRGEIEIIGNIYENPELLK